MRSTFVGRQLQLASAERAGHRVVSIAPSGSGAAVPGSSSGCVPGQMPSASTLVVMHHHLELDAVAEVPQRRQADARAGEHERGEDVHAEACEYGGNDPAGKPSITTPTKTKT